MILDGGTGRATVDVTRMTVVRKQFRPVDGASDPRHFAYWRRELLAYTGNPLPKGQLAQRVAAKDLDWTGIDVDERLRDHWERRDELLARLDCVPFVLSNGDFHLGHLVATDPEVTTVIDWANLGMSPLGAGQG